MGGYTTIAPEDQQTPEPQPQQAPSQPPPPTPPVVAQAAAPQGDEFDQRIKDYRNTLLDRIQKNTMPPAQGGPIKRLLSNFISAAGYGMMPVHQDPTFLAQQDTKTLNQLDQTQATIDYHRALVEQMRQKNAALPLEQAQALGHPEWAGLNPAQFAQAVSAANAQGKNAASLGVAQINQGMMMPIDEQTRQVLGLPEGTTQLPLKQLNEAITARTKPIGYQQGAAGPYEVNKITGQTRSLGIGNPRSIIVQARQYPAIDTQNDNALTFVNPFQIANGGGRYVPAGQGTTALNKTSLLEDIRGNVQATRSALTNLDSDFTPAFKAQLAVALRSTDPRSSISSLLNSAAAGSLNDKQQEAVIAMTNLVENSMAMRSVLGAGQGSDELRSAIQAVIPGPKTPSREYGLKQLDYFENTLNRLGRGVPKVPLRNDVGSLTADQARGYLLKAGGDKEKARALARADGHKF